MKTVCTYYIGASEEGKSYQELIEYFENNVTGRDSLTDFLYQVSKQEEIADKLLKLRSKYNNEAKADKDSFLSGEMTFSEVDNNKVFTTQTFIDSLYFQDENGKQYTPQINRDNFIQYIVQSNKKDMGEEAARDYGNQIVAHWDEISEDSFFIHKLLSKEYVYPSQLAEDLKGTKFEHLADKLWEVRENARKKCFYNMGGDTRVIRNLNLKCKAYGIDVDILGHIDNLIIDSSGDLHIVNYKVSTSIIEAEKMDKYKYQLALLKQMLAAEGFNVKHITLDILPIFIKYSDDLKQIVEIKEFERQPLAFDKETGKYKFEKYSRVAERFIKSNIVINTVENEDIDKCDKFLKVLFDERQINNEGIEVSAKEWIQRNSNHRIIPVTDKPGVKYKIVFSPNDVVEIKDFHSPLNNPEILEAVESRLNSLDMGNHEMSAHRIVQLFKVALEHKGFYSFSQERGYGRIGKYLDKIFSPYLEGTVGADGKFKPEWKIEENDLLLSRNIIALRNVNTGQIDIITVSPHNLQEVTKFRKVYTNILGNFMSDQKAIQEQVIKGNFGNIEMIRTMVVLNTVLQNMDGDFTLGSIKVISPENIGGEITYTFSQAMQQFYKIRNVVHRENGKEIIPNNFTGKKTTDAVQVFLKELDRAMSDIRVRINEEGGLLLRDPSSTREQRLQALRSIMRSIENTYQFNSFDQLQTLEGKSATLAEVVKLYKQVARAILQLENISDSIDFNEADMSSFESDFQSATNVSSNNVRLITGLFHQTVNGIAEKSYQDTRPIQHYLTEFYKAAGYSNLQNSTIGNQASVFKRLFQEVDGKRIMKFRNPWTDPDLKDYERKFLKQVTFTLAQVRNEMFPEQAKFAFTDYNDPELKEFAENNIWYLEVPLMKASKATLNFTRAGFSEWTQKAKRVFSLDGAKNITEFVEGLTTPEEVNRVNETLATLQVENRYGWYETVGGNENSRLERLEQKPIDYFEYNIENILMNFVTAQNQASEMQNFMLKTKAILLTINEIGDPNVPRLKNTLKYINDYLKINVYNKSILEERSKNMVAAVQPLRHLATSVYILGNLTSAVRDLTEGLMQNFVRSVIKYQTNIGAKSLTRAYKIVTKESLSNVRSINILNQLNIKYRLSNVDLARIQEVLSTGRGGIKNYENWLYSTLRRPDFINRMSLFVARCIEDGVWDAFYLDENGDLKYDWKRDSRFSYYAQHKNNPINDEKFLKQKGEYFGALLEYNRENPNNPLNLQDPDVALPNPYTNQQIEGIKVVADSIYGAYDQSKKAMYEFQMKGVVLGQFTTWMNGMVGNYFRKPGTATGELRLEQSVSDSGDLEFLDQYNNIVVQRTRADGSIYYYNETTGQEVEGPVAPLFKHVPVFGQGIVYSVMDLFQKTIPLGWANNGLEGVWEEFKKEIWLNPQERKNFLKLGSDLFIAILLSMLFKYAITPAYKEHKKERDRRNLALNSLEDILYGGVGASYDGFKGPWNLVTTYGENMNPPAYKVTVKMATDIGKTMIGDKTVGQTLTQNVPLLRSFRKAYDEYNKAQ